MKSQQTETCGSSARPELNLKQMLIGTTFILTFINESERDLRGARGRPAIQRTLKQAWICFVSSQVIYICLSHLDPSENSSNETHVHGIEIPKLPWIRLP